MEDEPAESDDQRDVVRLLRELGRSLFDQQGNDEADGDGNDQEVFTFLDRVREDMPRHESGDHDEHAHVHHARGTRVVMEDLVEDRP